jgi:peptidyl-prolyl cis-trans isomerase A (cyclophilin A)
MNNRTIRQFAASALFASSCLVSSVASATIVEFQTSEGNFQVNLYDETTPVTVANFLNYVNDGAYTEHVFHRSIPEFILQAGGYKFEGAFPLSLIDANDPIVNEAIYSNVSATIAMAKLSGDPDSASNQWFFNLADNSANLDLQNEGFTAFGQVTGDGMAILEKIAAIEVCSYSSSLSDIPMPRNDDQTCADLGEPGAENFVTIHQIVIVDSSSATAADLNPTLTTDTDHDGVPNNEDMFPEDPTRWTDDTDGDGVTDENDAYPTDPTRWLEDDERGSDGGSMGWLGALLAMTLFTRRKLSK